MTGKGHRAGLHKEKARFQDDFSKCRILSENAQFHCWEMPDTPSFLTSVSGTEPEVTDQVGMQHPIARDKA